MDKRVRLLLPEMWPESPKSSIDKLLEVDRVMQILELTIWAMEATFDDLTA